MAIRKSKKQKQANLKSTPKQRMMQIFLAGFALILILSMVLTAIKF